VTVTDVPEKDRYEARLDDKPAGFLQYLAVGDVVALVHTEVPEAFEGHGVGGALARGALDDLRARGLRVLPTCPFVAKWIELHPDYQDLVIELPDDEIRD
jgi:predicted GNAT family acetyltransferase